MQIDEEIEMILINIFKCNPKERISPKGILEILEKRQK